MKNSTVVNHQTGFHEKRSVVDGVVDCCEIYKQSPGDLPGRAPMLYVLTFST